MFVRGSIAILILFLFVTIVNGGTKFRSAQNLTVDEDILNGDEDGESFRATDVNDEINDTNDTYIDVDFDDHHHHENETVLSPTVLRWIPGGISVGIFVIFTIAATITTQMNQGNEKKEEGNMPDVADANFFEIDVVAKLKKKDNIFQRHLTQQKNRKFDLYNGMMRQYKDEIIAKRAQEQRHAELQKQKEMEKKRQEEKEKEKLGPLAKKILESSPRGTGSSSVPGISDSPNLRARAFTKTEDALLKPEGLAVPPPRSKSEGDAASIHRSKTEPREE